MSRDNTVRVRLSDQELLALKEESRIKAVPMSEILRDYVKTLINSNPTPTEYDISTQQQAS